MRLSWMMLSATYSSMKSTMKALSPSAVDALCPHAVICVDKPCTPTLSSLACHAISHDMATLQPSLPIVATTPHSGCGCGHGGKSSSTIESANDLA
mmetsp:Transcript_16276/g.35318  ORF Transcript_16276/g.35318 Transcript_16276/m.35318 type:complete len:96 (-) Transcript_16276:928-1215(-)